MSLLARVALAAFSLALASATVPPARGEDAAPEVCVTPAIFSTQFGPDVLISPPVTAAVAHRLADITEFPYAEAVGAVVLITATEQPGVVIVLPLDDALCGIGPGGRRAQAPGFTYFRRMSPEAFMDALKLAGGEES